jgi:hypothetical protein
VQAGKLRAAQQAVGGAAALAGCSRVCQAYEGGEVVQLVAGARLPSQRAKPSSSTPCALPISILCCRLLLGPSGSSVALLVWQCMCGRWLQ